MTPAEQLAYDKALAVLKKKSADATIYATLKAALDNFLALF
jgi:hypothetical protein